MLGELHSDEIERLLRTQCIARLGVCGDDHVYVFPVSYGYDGDAVYLVSHDGLKVELLRSHPEACIEVDDVQSAAEWRSVIVHGTYEELTDEAARDAAMAAIAGQGDTPSPLTVAPYIGGPDEVVVYRLRVTEKTGRFERSQAIALGRRSGR